MRPFQISVSPGAVGLFEQQGSLLVPRSIWPIHSLESKLRCAGELEKILVEDFGVPPSAVMKVYEESGAEFLTAAVFEYRMQNPRADDDSGEDREERHDSDYWNWP